MFYRLVETSDALRAMDVRLIPALCGCPGCQTVHVIASPQLGTCAGCGSELVVLPSDAPIPSSVAETFEDRDAA
jgi:hypothetical protein